MSMDQAIRILGGEGSNRLFRVLRSERGLTYSASADLNPMLLAGDITAETDTRTEATGEAVRVIVDEFTRLQRERIGDGELAGAQAYMTGSFPLTIETPGAIARQVVNVVFYDLSLDELRTYRQRANAVTPDDVLRVARTYIQPDRLSIVMVGDAAKFKDQLGKAGFGNYELIPLERARSHRGQSQEALNKIMISCGEPSGDLYAGALAVEIRRRQPDAAIFGLGGQRLMAGGGELLADYRGLSVTGLVEALRVLPKSLADPQPAGRRRAHARSPNALVLIDFPDFNFRLAAAVKKLGIPIIYYISPQLWAWRKSRMKVMKRLVDRVLVIFPFEEQIYRDAGVPVQFVGHPLVDLARAQEPEGRFPAGDRPRSRRGRSSRCCRAAGRTKSSDCCRSCAMRSRASPRSCRRRSSSSRARPRSTIGCFRTRSGTARGRSKCSREPTMCWRFRTWRLPHRARPPCRPRCTAVRWSWSTGLSPLTYRLGRRFLLVENVAMVNLIAGRRIVPELIQDDCTAENIAAETLSLLTNHERAEETRRGLADVRAKLGEPGASGRAAEAVLEIVDAKSRGL